MSSTLVGPGGGWVRFTVTIRFGFMLLVLVAAFGAGGRVVFV